MTNLTHITVYWEDNSSSDEFCPSGWVVKSLDTDGVDDCYCLHDEGEGKTIGEAIESALSYLDLRLNVKDFAVDSDGQTACWFNPYYLEA